MARGFVLVMDSVGIGAAEDAARYGDAGADTLGHIAEACAAGRAGPGRAGLGRAGLGRGALRLPHLEGLGLGAAAEASTGRLPAGFTPRQDYAGAWGYAVERSLGKDTPSGHWEMAGVPVTFDWAYFPAGPPSFPPALTEALIARGGLPGLLGNRHASGTQIIEELGAEHIAGGKPIVYTSGDSVLQIAAHEESFGLERLQALCRIARTLADPYNIGRVIARPFTGAPGSFRRTAHRHDYAVPPPEPTLLDRLAEAGGTVIGIGKIADIFSGRGISTSLAAADNPTTFDALLGTIREAPAGTLVLANFNDFDTLYGHRRDIAGYAAALEAFDERLPEVIAALRPGDLAVITADHGCDPSWKGTDHTREHVPVLAFGAGISGRALGRRDGFADIAQSLARHLGLPALPHGTNFV
jgi:phosphopentomutase